MKAVVALLASFWLLIFIAGAANPEYQHYREHVSLLAADGSRLIWVTTLAIACTSAAQWVGAYYFWTVNRPVAVLLGLAGSALALVAAFRVPCSRDSRHCPFTVEHTASEAVHNAGVVAYAVVTMAAMVLLGVMTLVNGQHSLVGVPGLVAAVIFALTYSGLLFPPEGLAQRTWIAVGQIWLVAAVNVAQQRRLREAPLTIGR